MDPDLRDLLLGWMGEDLEPARCDELLAKLGSDHDFRKAFVAEIRMLGMLQAVQSAEPRWLSLEDELGWKAEEPVTIEAFQEQVRQWLLVPLPRPWIRGWKWAVAAVAAAVVLVAGLAVWPRPKGARSATILALVAKLERIEWETPEDRHPSEGDSLGADHFRLRKGLAKLSLLNGVELFVEGPSDVELVNLDKVLLHRGKLRVRVAKGAEGFTVSGPGSLVVDLGTEFALNVTADKVSRGKVFQGKVNAALLNTEGNPSRTQSFSEGQSFEIDPQNGGITAITKTEDFVTPSTFVPPPLKINSGYADVIRESRPWSYWRFDSLVEGTIPNEMAGRPSLRVTGPIRLNGIPGRNQTALFPEGHTGQYLSMDNLWQPPRIPGFAVELWFLSESVSHASLISLIAPRDTNRHYFLMETTCRQRATIQHPPDFIRVLHRWPPGSGGGVNLYSSNPYFPYRWHHLVCQINKNRIELILDGEFLSSTIITPLDESSLGQDRRVDGEAVLLKSVVDTPASKPCQFLIGRLTTIPVDGVEVSRPFVGQIDEVAIYDRPLPLAEIRRHHQAVLMDPPPK